MNWLSQLLDKLTSTELAATLAVVIPAILKLASLVKLDVTRLPKWVQPIPALVLAFLGATLEQLQQGATVKDALIVIVFGWLGGIGAYHTMKRYTPSLRGTRLADEPTDEPAPPTLRGATTLLVLAALLLGGCGIVKSASDEVASICEGYLAAQPEVQAQARAKAVSPIVIAEAICMANDAGRAIWELFQVQQPEPGVMMAVSPNEQLERARDHALLVARQRGILP